MSTISGLNASNAYSLLSSAQSSSTTSNLTNSQSSGTASQTPSSSVINLQYAVELTLMEESTSLIQSLFGSNSSQGFVSILETSATVNAIAKANLFESNPQLAESLLGETLPFASTETSATTSASSPQSGEPTGNTTTPASSSQSTASSDIASELLASAEGAGLDESEPDLTQSLLQTLQPNSTNGNSSLGSGLILDLLA